MPATFIETKGFYIHFDGDMSVGIFPCTWKIEGYFSFDTEEDLKVFKDKLTEAWEYCSDTPTWIETFEEHESELKRESEMFESGQAIEETLKSE